jgi:hypothetical protein
MGAPEANERLILPAAVKCGIVDSFGRTDLSWYKATHPVF